MDEQKLLELLIVMSSDIASIKTNLEEHMRRTELLEKTVETHKKHLNMMQGALALIITIASILKLFR